MADNKILIKFKAHGDTQLRNAIKALAKEQEKLNRTITDTEKGTGALDTKSTRLRKTNGFLANSFATVRSKMLLFTFAMSMGVRQITQFMIEAAKVESMERAFNTLSGGTENATIAIDKLREATNGTMNDFNLFQQANNAMILGVSKNSDEMAEMFDIAQRLGRALGRDTASSVESLITGIGRQSRLMLDNIGIIVKADEAYRDYARILGTTADKLTDAQKKQAFFSATMDAARSKVKKLGEETLGTQDRFDRFSTALDNSLVHLGESLHATTLLVDVLTELLNLLPDIEKSFVSTTNHMQGYAFSARLLLKTLNMINDGEIKFISERDKIIKQLAEEQKAREKIGETVEDALAFSEAETFALREGFGRVESMVDSYIKKVDTAQQINADYSDGLNVVTRALKVAGMAQQQYVEAIIASSFRTGLATKDMGESFKIITQQLVQDLAFQATLFLMKDAVQKLGWAGVPLAAAAAGTVGALVGKISDFEDGGYVGGRRHSQGGTIIEAEQGEFVMSRRAVESVGLDAMNRINQGKMAGNVVINVTGNVMSQDYVEGELADQLRMAIRRGADIGVS